MDEERRVLLHFKTTYYTRWGENLVISGPSPIFGKYDPNKYVDDGIWIYTGIRVPSEFDLLLSMSGKHATDPTSPLSTFLG